MNEVLIRTLERLQDVGEHFKDTKLHYRMDDCEGESVLDREQRRKYEKDMHLKLKREVAIKKRVSLGLPTHQVRTISANEYDQFCEPGYNYFSNEHPQLKMEGPDPDKPQNHSPRDYRATGDDEVYFTDHGGRPRIINLPLLRAKEHAKRLERNKITPISRVFPFYEARRRIGTSEKEQPSLDYLYTSSYRAAYGKQKDEDCVPVRQTFPIPLLEGLPDPLRALASKTDFHAPSNTWQPANFDSAKFDIELPRYNYGTDERPYEFSTHYSRINQIMGYSGVHGTRQPRVEDDDPYKPYEPMTVVRGVTPAKPPQYPRYNIPGYTGSVYTHEVKRELPADWTHYRGHLLGRNPVNPVPLQPVEEEQDVVKSTQLVTEKNTLCGITFST